MQPWCPGNMQVPFPWSQQELHVAAAVLSCSVTPWEENFAQCSGGVPRGRGGGSRGIPEHQPPGEQLLPSCPSSAEQEGLQDLLHMPDPKDSVCHLGCPRAWHTAPLDNTPGQLPSLDYPLWLQRNTCTPNPCSLPQSELTHCSPQTPQALAVLYLSFFPWQELFRM